jgi:hypothetical protein
VSWDLYRNMLGLTFILLSLPLLQNSTGAKKSILLSLLVVLAVASDQLTGVIILTLLAVRTLTAIVHQKRKDLQRLLQVGLPGTLLFFAIVYSGELFYGGLVQGQASIPSNEILVSSVGFLGYAYAPLIPLILLGFRRIQNSDLRTWSWLCIVGAMSTLLPFLGLIVKSYRWTLLLDVPLCIYASAGLARLLASTPSFTERWTRLRPAVLPILSASLIISAALYVGLPAQRALPYFAAFPPLLPTSMIQDSIPLSDMQNLNSLLIRASANMGPSTVLIAHMAIYGWARAYLSSNAHLINYGYSSPLEGVAMANSAGYTTILMIWWVNGSGWHDQPCVPIGFVPESQLGDLTLYTFQSS